MQIELLTLFIATVVLNIAMLRVRNKWPSKLKSVFIFAVLIILGFIFAKGINFPNAATFGWFVVGFFHGGLFVLGGEREPSQTISPIKRTNANPL